METTSVVHSPETSTSATDASSVVSLIELSDSEILEWLSTSVLEEFDPQSTGETADDTLGDSFWERVAELETQLTEQGHDARSALDLAVALLGLDASLNTATTQSAVDHSATATPASPLFFNASQALAPADASLGTHDLVQTQQLLVNRAQRAVELWSSLQGSALRAAHVGRP